MRLSPALRLWLLSNGLPRSRALSLPDSIRLRDVLSAEALQALIAACARLYTARREAGEDFAPVGHNAVSATDVMVTSSGLLRAVGLAAFELGMWQGFTGR